MEFRVFRFRADFAVALYVQVEIRFYVILINHLWCHGVMLAVSLNSCLRTSIVFREAAQDLNAQVPENTTQSGRDQLRRLVDREASKRSFQPANPKTWALEYHALILFS